MGAFWNFSLETYDREGVAETCLALQERAGLDVNLLLFCLWAGSRGRRIEREEMETAVRAVESWQRDVVATFRKLRRRLKELSEEPGNEARRLREQAMRRELDAEEVEQRILEGALDVLTKGPSDPAAAKANLRLYLETAEHEVVPEIDRLLARLLKAALPARAPIQ